MLVSGKHMMTGMNLSMFYDGGIEGGTSWSTSNFSVWQSYNATAGPDKYSFAKGPVDMLRGICDWHLWYGANATGPMDVYDDWCAAQPGKCNSMVRCK